MRHSTPQLVLEPPRAIAAGKTAPRSERGSGFWQSWDVGHLLHRRLFFRNNLHGRDKNTFLLIAWHYIWI
ncbi:unnamed protein product [Urochloa humidicola]